MSQEETGYTVEPLGELQWWSLEVISGTVIALAIGITAGRQEWGIVQTLLVAAAFLLGVFALGALLRRVSLSRSVYVEAAPDRVFDAVLSLSGRSPFLQSMWGIVLRVERNANLLKAGMSVETAYSVSADALSLRSGRTGEVTVKVDELEPSRKLVQVAQNKFRGRTTRSIGVTRLEPQGAGVLLTVRTRLILPMNASHFIGAVYARMVLSKATTRHLAQVRALAEGRR